MSGEIVMKHKQEKPEQWKSWRQNYLMPYNKPNSKKKKKVTAIASFKSPGN